MKINVSSILKRADSSIRVKDELCIPFINYNEEDIPVNSPIAVEALITNTGEHLLITGNIQGVLHLKCSRCLEGFDYNLECDFEEEMSNKDDGEDLIHFEGDTIDLTDIVINSILLNLPMKAVCKEECKGLCPHCGNNMNNEQCDCTNNSTDPRLAVLKKLLKDS